jgi:hypothetical protein
MLAENRKENATVTKRNTAKSDWVGGASGGTKNTQAQTYAEVVTRDEANVILARGYPSQEDISRFPLADLLESIPSVDPRYGKQQDGKLGHIDKVIEGINILLSPHPECIVKQWATEKPFSNAIVFEQAYQKIFGGEYGRDPSGFCNFVSTAEELQAFFRLLALYHDIGKAIILERHPMVGWHLVKDVYRKSVEQKLYPLILGHDYRDWNARLEKAHGNVDQIVDHREQRMLKIFGQAVRFHDYFGVLSTGEGSMPLMLDVVDLCGMEPSEAQEIFSTLMILNLADVYGSVGEILPQKVSVYCEDWRFLCDTISAPEVHGDRSLFFDAIRKKTQTANATIQRLWRLVYEGAPPEWRDKINPGTIEEIFRDATLSRMYPFIKNYALFCKLDYCLRYTSMLMNTAMERKTEPAVPVHAMISLLAELEKRYGDLCERNDGTWRRIGFEMAGLTRRPGAHKDHAQRTKSRIGETIANLHLQPGSLGKEWAVSECTVWFMEE